MRIGLLDENKITKGFGFNLHEKITYAVNVISGIKLLCYRIILPWLFFIFSHLFRAGQVLKEIDIARR